MHKRLGHRFSIVSPVVGTVFPNFSMLRSAARTFRVMHPKGPDKIEMRSCIFVDKAAPPEVKDALRITSLKTFGPGGTFEQDDMDNWQGCTETCRGVVSRRYDLNGQMGLGHERFSEDLMAWVSDYRFSELNQRAFYRRWAEVMAARNWEEM